jgi:NAD(P)-dependent dehydrogenase (short-subunit alcohol dehydrogenase family)
MNEAAPHQLQDTPNRYLEGKVSIITGGASGIGLATAKRLLKEGSAVAIFDINQEALEKVTQELTEGYGAARVLGVVCDITNEGSILHAFKEVVDQWERLDILVNNAGVAKGCALVDLTAEEYDRQNAIMPRGSFLCTREAARIFIEKMIAGDIVYVVSKNAVYAGGGNLAYSTAKAAQLHQARLAAVDLAPHGIRVNSVNPDAVVTGTGIFAGKWADERAKTFGIKREELSHYYAQRTLLKLELLPEDIAAAIYVLVGPELRKSTGLVLSVDGGSASFMMR